MVRYFEGGTARYHKVLWDGKTTSTVAKILNFVHNLSSYITSIFHGDCFKIPPLYLPPRWHCDALKSKSNSQEVEKNVLP